MRKILGDVPWKGDLRVPHNLTPGFELVEEYAMLLSGVVSNSAPIFVRQSHAVAAGGVDKELSSCATQLKNSHPQVQVQLNADFDEGNLKSYALSSVDFIATPKLSNGYSSLDFKVTYLDRVDGVPETVTEITRPVQPVGQGNTSTHMQSSLGQQNSPNMGMRMSGPQMQRIGSGMLGSGPNVAGGFLNMQPQQNQSPSGFSMGNNAGPMMGGLGLGMRMGGPGGGAGVITCRSCGTANGPALPFCRNCRASLR
ncbi:unnamed protein product [Echinostoma caproni]|uniref:Zinc_ribbon_2 domain-containing protein n=1 Tax=Echinostoma caproni TaxID=27848 RepID=A0A183AQG9_9TREM|nr:unnamed protein product [Echinostoma caproni]